MHDGLVHAHRYKQSEVNVECRGGERDTGVDDRGGFTSGASEILQVWEK